MEFHDFVDFLGGDLLRQPNHHTSPKQMMQLVIWEVRGSVTNKGVFRLNRNSVIPKVTGALGHREEFVKCVFFPVLHEVIGTKLYHKGGEGKGNNAFTVRSNAICHTIIQESADNQGYLIVRDDLLVNEII